MGVAVTVIGMGYVRVGLLCCCAVVYRVGVFIKSAHHFLMGVFYTNWLAKNGLDAFAKHAM